MRIPILLALAAVGCDGLEPESTAPDGAPSTPPPPPLAADGLHRGTLLGQHGPLEVTYRVADGVPWLDSDVPLRWDDFVDPAVAYSGVASRDKRWTAGIVPYVIDGYFPDTSIPDAIAHWQAHTNLRFIPRTNQSDYIRFKNGDACNSEIGRSGGRQDINLMSAGCGFGPTVHEIGHAIGFHHEQKRADRDSYVSIYWDNIEDDMTHNFEKYGGQGTSVGPYDFNSIMHYGTFAFSKTGLETIMRHGGMHVQGQGWGLSQGDLSGAEYLYGPPTALGRTSVIGRDNRLNLFVRGADNLLYRNYESSVNGAWNGWRHMPGISLRSAPLAIRHHDGRLELFALGADTRLWHSLESAGGTWSAWTSLGTTVLTGAPSVVRHQDGHLEVFARGADGGVWRVFQTAVDGAWSPMVTFGGSTAAAPTAQLRSDGRVQVFVTGTDGKLWSVLSGVNGAGWSGWLDHGGAITNVPAVARNLDGTLSVFARGTDGKLRYARQAGAGSTSWTWYTLGLTSQTFLGSPAVGRNRDGRLEVVAIGADTSTWRIAQASANSFGWGPWGTFGGTTSTRLPEIAVHDDGRLDVFVVGVNDRALYSARQNQPALAWNGWVGIPGLQLTPE